MIRLQKLELVFGRTERTERNGRNGRDGQTDVKVEIVIYLGWVKENDNSVLQQSCIYLEDEILWHHI